MRELVIDAASQPIRNQHLNPIPTGSISRYNTANGASIFFDATRPAIRVEPGVDRAQSGAAVLSAYPIAAGERFEISLDIESSQGGVYMFSVLNSTPSHGLPQGTDIVLAAGEKRRVSYSGVSLVAGNITAYFVRRNGTPDANPFWISRVRVGGQDYYDGDSYGWRWLGAAGASEAVGYPRSPLLIRNQHARPVPIGGIASIPDGGTGWASRWFGSGGANGVNELFGTGGPGGRGFVRKRWTALPTGGNGAANDVGWTLAIKLPISEMPVAFSTWVRLSAPGVSVPDAGNFVRLRIEYYDAVGAQVNASAAQSQVGTRGWSADQWVRVEGAAPSSIPVGAATFSVNIEPYLSLSQLAIGMTIDATMAMFGPGVYCDGYMPGWRWLGSAGASASEGYPYTLEGVSGGAVDGRIAGVGGVDMPDRPDPLRGMAFYTVYDVVNADGQYQEIGSMGHGSSVAEGRFTIQSSAAGNPTMNPRVDFKGGESNRTTSPPGSRAPGRHILSVRVPDGMQAMRARVDGGQSLYGHASGLNPGQGIAGTRLRAVAVASLDPRDTVGIQREIDDLTDLAIHRWLANAHGIDTFTRIAGAPVVDIVNPVPGTTIDIPTGPLTIILVGRQAGDTSVSPGYWEIANNSTGGWVGALGDRRRRLLAGGVSPGNLRQDVMRADDGAVWNIPQGQASQLAVISTTVNDAGMRTRYNLLPEVANEPTTPALATPMNVTKMRIGVRDGGTQAGTDLRRLSIWPGVLDLATREALVREVAFMHQISL